MLDFLKPDFVLNSVSEITPVLLREQKVEGLLVDLDNTLLPWGGNSFSKEVENWVRRTQAEGVKMVLISNSPWARLRDLAEKLGVPAVRLALKPVPFATWKALRLLRLPREKVIFVGDQLLTDILLGKLVKVRTAWVRPISPREFFITRWFARRLEGWLTRLWKLGD